MPITTNKIYDNTVLVSTGDGDVSVNISSGTTMLSIQVSGPWTGFSSVTMGSDTGVSVINNPDGNNRLVQQYYIKNTTTGAQTISFRNGSGGITYRIIICEHTGIDVSGDPVRSSASTSTDFGSNTSLSLTTENDDLVVGAMNTSATDVAIAGGATDLFTGLSGASNGGYASFGYNSGTSPSTAFSWTHSSERRAAAAVTYKIATAPSISNAILAYFRSFLNNF